MISHTIQACSVKSRKLKVLYRYKSLKDLHVAVLIPVPGSTLAHRSAKKREKAESQTLKFARITNQIAIAHKNMRLMRQPNMLGNPTLITVRILIRNTYLRYWESVLYASFALAYVRCSSRSRQVHVCTTWRHAAHLEA